MIDYALEKMDEDMDIKTLMDFYREFEKLKTLSLSGIKLKTESDKKTVAAKKEINDLKPCTRHRHSIEKYTI